MNRKMLGKLRDHRVRIRPVARRFDETGEELEQIDDTWGVGQASPQGVVLYNFRTNHIVTLRADAIHHYQEEHGDRRGILHLHVQVFLQGRHAPVEPLVYPERTVMYLPIHRSTRRRLTSPYPTERNQVAGALGIALMGAVLIGALHSWDR